MSEHWGFTCKMRHFFPHQLVIRTNNLCSSLTRLLRASSSLLWCNWSVPLLIVGVKGFCCVVSAFVPNWVCFCDILFEVFMTEWLWYFWEAVGIDEWHHQVIQVNKNIYYWSSQHCESIWRDKLIPIYLSTITYYLEFGSWLQFRCNASIPTPLQSCSSVKMHIFHHLGPVPKHRTPDSAQPHPLRIHPDWTSCQCEHHLHAWRGAPLWSVCRWQSSSLALKIDRTIKLGWHW